MPSVLEAQVSGCWPTRARGARQRNFALRGSTSTISRPSIRTTSLFPGFTEELRAGFRDRDRAVPAQHPARGPNVRELLTADHTFLNERLARHYGIAGVLGPQFRRVTLEDEARHGLLGKGAVLLRTSYGDRTSPVLRGAWVLEKLMGTPPAPPPPERRDGPVDAGGRAADDHTRAARAASRDRCNGCHGVIDPYGLALENFTRSASGATRRDADAPIDASTELPGGIADRPGPSSCAPHCCAGPISSCRR
jgi:hypothetical protein